MAFARNRISGESAVPHVLVDNVSVSDGEAELELSLSEDHHISVYFPAVGGVVERQWLDAVSDILAHLTHIDNEVQRASAEQCERSPYPASSFEGYLYYFTLTDPDNVVFRYVVIGVNAEWDEYFVRNTNGWHRIEPDGQSI